ncbi:hypothetical protein KGQ27_00665 [Patescibacteria group bacterium]|nr:hypothetical protein [Patescibacteria group bacterium]MDE1946859.1 hypothetical protein [Patescibacteria group bacterium]
MSKIANYNQMSISSGQIQLSLAWTCGSHTLVGPDGLTYGTVVGADGNCWLDRNLGATEVATAYNDANAYGYYYQWGRGMDGHQISTSLTTNTLSSTDQPGNSNFILAPSSPYDWRSPQNNNLWQGASGVNNPCPNGFRLPTNQEWSNLVSAAGITDYSTAFSSSLKLTLAGDRDYSSGSLSPQGGFGLYWSSSVSGANAFSLYFSSSGVSPSYSYYRAYGFSVRCIKN